MYILIFIKIMIIYYILNIFKNDNILNFFSKYPKEEFDE